MGKLTKKASKKKPFPLEGEIWIDPINIYVRSKYLCQIPTERINWLLISTKAKIVKDGKEI